MTLQLKSEQPSCCSSTIKKGMKEHVKSNYFNRTEQSLNSNNYFKRI